MNLYADHLTSGLDAAKPTVKPDIATILPNTFAFYYATDTGVLYKWNGTSWDANFNSKTQAVGAALTAKGSVSGAVYELNTAAGSVLTLPGATGSGLSLTAYVGVAATSNAHKILTSPITDKLIGRAVGMVAAGTTLSFSAARATGYHSIQMPFAGTQPSGGLEGDIFNFTDVEAGIWLVEGMYESGTTSTTPFSTATT